MYFQNLLTLLVLSVVLLSCAQAHNRSSSIDNHMDTSYDSVKAKHYGADDYGMKKYVVAFLKKGPNRNLDSAQAVELQTAHLKNIKRMAELGALVLAGPFLGDGELRGIYVFDVPSIEEAEELTNTDPAIKAGSLVLELREWYGSAGLMEINEIHKTLAKKSF